ncbi:MAG: phosphate signaling complex protein PhoU [Bacillota bacterium]
MARKAIPRRELDAVLQTLCENTLSLSGQVEKMLHESVQSLKAQDLDLAQSVVDADDQIDDGAIAIEKAAESIIARHQPVASDLRRIISTMRIVLDLERIADLSVNIARATLKMDEPLLKPLIDIPRMASIAQEMVRSSLNSLIEGSEEGAWRVRCRDDEIDALHWQIFRELLTYMIDDPRSIHRAIPLLFVARYLERIGDHATNIAEMVIYFITGERVTSEGGYCEE